MAARKDYGPKKGGRGASRAAPKRAANRAANKGGSRTAAAPARRRTPWFKMLVALSLVGGMAYLLYSLTQVGRPASSASPKSAAKVASTPKPAPKPKTAPPESSQEERFEFYKMLPESEVKTDQVDAYQSTPKDAKLKYRYLLQAGSFRDPADAERMRAKLILLGLPNAHTSKVSGKNGTWYRVRVGPFDNRSLLNRAQDKLVRQRIQPMEIKLK